jgi:hypothetical protein
VAASGGCPELFEVVLDRVPKNTDQLTLQPSLVVPSVRNVWIDARLTEEAALLLCCGLVQMGYKHGLTTHLQAPGGKYLSSSAYSCMRATLGGGGMKAILLGG